MYLDAFEDGQTCTIYGLGNKGGRVQKVAECATVDAEREIAAIIREWETYETERPQRVKSLVAVDDMGREVAFRSAR